MAMLDRHFNQLFPEQARSWFRENIVPVDLTDVSKWFYEVNDKDYWDWEEDFPTMAPPWNVAWYEWVEPEFYRSGDETIPSLRDRGLSRVGVLVTSYPTKEGNRTIPGGWHPMAEGVMRAYEWRGGEVNDTTEFEGSDPVRGVHWLSGYHVYLETTRKGLVHAGFVADYLNEFGRPFADRRQILADTELAKDGAMALGPLLPLAFGISLLHAKNTQVVDREVSERLQRARRRRGRSPLFTYKTLEIEPMKQVLRTEGRIGEVGLKQALHICRGHFKDYRERGLFGRESHRGIYWWESHVRGSASEGVVAKDYKVNAPAVGESRGQD